MYGLNELSTNSFYWFFVNCLDEKSINIFPCDICGMHKMSVAGLKKMFASVCPCDVIEYFDLTSESDLPVMNALGTELSLNGLNVLNSLGP